MKVEFYRHNLEEEDIQRAVEVLRSVFLTTGPVTAEFEEKFAAFTGLKECVALNSCTAALHLALLSLGIGPGDEVITTPMTFIATLTTIMHTGATPVPVDVEPATGLIDAGLIEGAVTERTRAVLPVHLYGTMADMRAIRSVADRHGLKVVEDSAHCVEGERDGVRPGQLSDASCYSFYATKNLTCGEGGALCTNEAKVADEVRALKLHGMSRDAASRYGGAYRHWDMIRLGWKYNMDDIHAALLVAQIGRLTGYLARRKEICARYDAAFGPLEGVRLPRTMGAGARHLYTILVAPETRDEVVSRLQARGVGVAVNYRAVHTLTYLAERFGYAAGDFPHADLIGRSTITLPLYTRLTDVEVDYVITAVKEAVQP